MDDENASVSEKIKFMSAYETTQKYFESNHNSSGTADVSESIATMESYSSFDLGKGKYSG